MRFLVTGTSGFIGSHLVRALVAHGHLVHGVDVRQSDLPQNVPAEHHPIDVLNRGALHSLFEQFRFDAVVHLAAGVGPDEVVANPYHTVAVNVAGTENVLDAAGWYSPKARLLFTSTSEVYGLCADEQFNEDTSSLVLGPSRERRWCYAASKISAEHLVLAQGGTVLRLFNTTGPGQSEEYVLPRFVGLALRGEDIRVYGGGSQVRCFCHVKDVVRALVTLMTRPMIDAIDPRNQVYNLGSDQSLTIQDLAQQVRAQVNPNVGLLQVTKPPEGSLTMPYRKPDLSKIKAAIGWAPEIPLATIIDDVMNWKLSGGAS